MAGDSSLLINHGPDPAAPARERTNSAATREKKPGSTSRGSFLVQTAAFIVFNLLFSPGAGKLIANEDVAEMGLTICHIDNWRSTRGRPTHMRDFIDAIADKLPIDETRTTLGVYQLGTDDRLLLSIFHGSSRKAVKSVKGSLMHTDERAHFRDRNRCVDGGLEKGRQALYDDLKSNSTRHRRQPAKVSIGVTVFRMDETFADTSDWKTRVFDDQLRRYWRRDREKRVDVSVVFEIADGYYYYGVMWRLENKSVGSDCCNKDPKKLAETVFDAVRKVMRICMQNETERCYLDANGDCLANVSYTTTYKRPHENARFCDERNPEFGLGCSLGAAGCMQLEQTTASASAPARTTQRSSVSWKWLVPCLVAVAIAGTVAIVAAVRQCVNYSRQRRLERQKLAECGMICKRKPQPSRNKKLLEPPETTSFTDSKLSATAASTIMPAALNRTSIRPTEYRR